MTAITCVLSPIAVPLPFSPVPVSLGTFAMFLCGGLLSPGAAVMTQIVYLLLGAIGLPVFTGFQGGVGKLLGPTGGYLFSYPLMVLLISYTVGWGAKLKTPALRPVVYAGGMAAAMLVCYALGTVWFCYQQQTTVGAALAACVVPFLLPDALKIAACAAILPILRGRVYRNTAPS
jgi:biotin transport system substrate-specific component